MSDKKEKNSFGDTALGGFLGCSILILSVGLVIACIFAAIKDGWPWL